MLLPFPVYSGFTEEPELTNEDEKVIEFGIFIDKWLYYQISVSTEYILITVNGIIKCKSILEQCRCSWQRRISFSKSNTSALC